MKQLNTAQRRTARNAARAGAVLSAAMFAFSVAGAFGLGSGASAIAQNAGALTVVVPPGTATEGQAINSGGSATAFALAPPSGAACTGDSATGGYRVQSYMVPASVDPATLTYDANGPLPAGTGSAYRQPLFSASGTPYTNGTTGVATVANPGGLITGLPPLSFSLFGADGPTVVPAGTYNLGFACTLGNASATQLDKYWNVQLTFAVTPTDTPSGITWTVVAASPATTTSIAATTTTAAGGATTTTVRSTATTTTVRPAATTTTTSSAAVVTATTLRSSSGSSNGAIPTTGWSSLPIVIWAMLLLVCGRMAILLGRPLRVLPILAS